MGHCQETPEGGSNLTVHWDLSSCHGDVAAPAGSERFGWERQGYGGCRVEDARERARWHELV